MTKLHAPHISVVSPVYGCAAALSELCERLHKVLGSITADYDIIFVNDASPDSSWIEIQALANLDSRVKGINLSRNFGQHYAITAGLDYARGDWVIVIDCDLQDVPEEIINLYEAAQLGYELVVGRRVDRQDHWLKKMFSNFFYRVFEYFSEERVDGSVANYGIYSKKVINKIRELKEMSRSFGLLVRWVGFRRLEIDIKHNARPYGRSSYTLKKMLALSFDNILAHSDKALRVTVLLGLCFSVISFFYVIWVVAHYFFWQKPIVGWSSIVAAVFLSAGLIILTIGVVGLYVGKIFDQVKNRPLYIIAETTFESDVR